MIGSTFARTFWSRRQTIEKPRGVPIFRQKTSRLGAPAAQRIDKWLCFARVVKTRTLAARLVEAGHVRLNGVRSDNAAKMLRCGDVLTIALERQVRVLRVVADGERRGPFSEASLLFEDLGAARGDVAV